VAHRLVMNAFRVESTLTDELDCLFCKNKHSPLKKEDGFYTNLGLLELVESKANHVYRGENVENLKSKLADLQTKSDECKANLENGTDQVKEYCLHLRNKSINTTKPWLPRWTTMRRTASNHLTNKSSRKRNSLEMP
jgi:hypothetical protein